MTAPVHQSFSTTNETFSLSLSLWYGNALYKREHLFSSRFIRKQSFDQNRFSLNFQSNLNPSTFRKFKMKSFFALFVLIAVSVAVVSAGIADCVSIKILAITMNYWRVCSSHFKPDKVYNCFDSQNYPLGKVCGGTCGNTVFGTCRPCDK